MDSTWDAIFGFVSLLLFPLLGILTMLKRRASPLLQVLVIAWLALGAVAFFARWHPGLSREEFLHGWWIGAALGAAFLAIDWLRTRRPIARWIKIAIGALTILGFLQALHHFLERYA